MSVNEKMTAIADAIRGKTGGTELLTLDAMATEISNITGLTTDVIEFSQINDIIMSYLTEAIEAYTDDNGDSISVVSSYETYNYKDKAVGYDVASTSGSLYLQNENTGNGWKQTPETIYNTIPEQISQYVVKDTDGNVIENGRIKPLGNVRMFNFQYDAHNSRDLGGWICDGGIVSYGKLFRGAVANKDDDYYKPINAQLASQIGVRRHLDFRGDNEADNMTESPFGTNVYYNRITLDQYYADIINPEKSDYQNTIAVFREIFDAVSHNEPLYFNCSLGRDRTGTIAFMILALLGVPKKYIDIDYELSSFSSVSAWESKTIPAYRTGANYIALVDYINGLGRATLRDNVIVWFINAGFTLGELNSFRRAMTAGTPDELTTEEFAETYTITYNLTDCVSDNVANKILSTDVFTATLSSDNGYEINEITVTMGGVDVSDDCVSSSTVTINEVTGNIVITAKPHTNKMNGYTENYRISSSSGGNSSLDGYVVTDYIRFTNNNGEIPTAIYISGVDMDDVVENQNFCCVYTDSAGTTSKVIWFGSGTGLDVIESLSTETHENYYKIQVLSDEYESTVTPNYIRLHGKKIDTTETDFIITFDQPIFGGDN